MFLKFYKKAYINLLSECVPACSPGVCEEQGNYKDDPGNWETLSGRSPKHEDINTMEECRLGTGLPKFYNYIEGLLPVESAFHTMLNRQLIMVTRQKIGILLSAKF